MAAEPETVQESPNVTVVRTGERAVVVILTGEHDLASAPALKDRLTACVEESDLVVVDLSEVLFLDSSIIAALAFADRAARKSDKHVRLQIGSAPFVRRVLEISGLLQVLDCVVTREAALEPRAPIGA